MKVGDVVEVTCYGKDWLVEITKINDNNFYGRFMNLTDNENYIWSNGSFAYSTLEKLVLSDKKLEIKVMFDDLEPGEKFYKGTESDLDMKNGHNGRVYTKLKFNNITINCHCYDKVCDRIYYQDDSKLCCVNFNFPVKRI